MTNRTPVEGALASQGQEHAPNEGRDHRVALIRCELVDAHYQVQHKRNAVVSGIDKVAAWFQRFDCTPPRQPNTKPTYKTLSAYLRACEARLKPYDEKAGA